VSTASAALPSKAKQRRITPALILRSFALDGGPDGAGAAVGPEPPALPSKAKQRRITPALNLHSFALDGEESAPLAPPAPAAPPLPNPPQPLAIAGLARCSTCDWPGRIVATVFLQGCPWRCSYCHNPDLIDPRRPGTIAWEEVAAFLATRRGLLDAVVFSGGEPTRQDLRDTIIEVRDLGFKVGLHTMGAYPRRLANLLPLLDWVGFDVKAAPGAVEAITGAPGSTQAMGTSLRLLLDSGVDYQVRTTWGPGIMTEAEARAAQSWARAQGARDPILQPARPVPQPARPVPHAARPVQPTADT
jgi:pyruvate formate lyase activating enzyme